MTLFKKVPDPDRLPSGPPNNYATGCAFPPDEAPYLAVTTDHALLLYKRSGGIFSYLDGFSYGNTCYGGSFTANASYLAIPGKAPRLTIYKRAGDAFSALTDPVDVGPADDLYQVSFSTAGDYLAGACYASPYIYIWKKSGADTWTKLGNPAVLPTGITTGCSLDWDGNYLAVSHYTTPFITIYKRSDSTFTKLDDPVDLPPGNSQRCAFSSNARWLAIGSATSPYLTLYLRDGDTFTKITPDSYPPECGYGAHFSSDGNFLVVSHYLSPFVTIYRRSGDTWNKVLDSDRDIPLPDRGYENPAFSMVTTEGFYLSVSHWGYPYLTIYRYASPTSPPFPTGKHKGLPPTEPSPIMLPAVAWGKVGRGTAQPFRDPRMSAPINTSWKCPLDWKEPRPGDHMSKRRTG